MFYLPLIAAIQAGHPTNDNINFNVSSERIYETLKEKGVVELSNPFFSKEDYNRLYESFDYFIELIKNDKNLLEKLTHTEKEFLSMENLSNQYCSTPPSYRDYLEHTQKRHDKIYFQFIKEHYELFKSAYPELLQSNPQIQEFFEQMVKIDEMAKKMFNVVVSGLQEKHPEVENCLLGKNREFTVVTKIVRYEKSDKWGTTPHFDKSGLTLIWDSDDEDHDSLLVCEKNLDPNVADLKKPKRNFANMDKVTSTLLIVGSCLSKVGININPTLHGVSSINKDRRHSVISFALVPNIDTSDLQTDFIK